jgi:tripartite-type tricarboxylate transporter receptor subunit TctC
MNKRVRSTARFITAALIALGAVAGAHAEGGYPNKPVRIIIGFAPGGPADIAGRVIAPALTEQLGQSVVVENRGGAGGTIGLDAVAKSPPDGYTLALGSSGNLIMAPHLYPKIPYNVLKDFAPVAMLAVSSYVLAINPTVPAKNMAEFVRIAKSKKKLLSYGTSGPGSTSHIAAELLAQSIGAEFVHVPYKGTGPSLTGVVAGEIDMMIADLTPAQPHAKSGRLRLLAVVGSKRSSAAPELPTMAEAGVKMQPVEGRYGILAPAGTPKDILARLHTAVIAALKNPDVKQRYGQIGFDIIGDTPEHFASTLKSEGEIFGAVIRKAGIESN